MRPKELAADITTTYEVITHLLEHIDCEYLLLLQPTSPLRTSHHIDEALIQLKKSDSVVSVVKVEHPVEWSNELTINNCMDNFYQGAKRNLRSQDLPVRFRINGAIYAVKVKQFLKEKSFIFKNGSYAYEMDEISSIDIDNEQQFLLALINKIGIDEVVSKLNTV
jgi:CMP-N,N'-diacetyllegionaminic acid synthase